MQLVPVKAGNLASNNMPLHIEHGGGQGEIKERLLAIAQGLQAPFAPIRPLLEDHRQGLVHSDGLLGQICP